MAGPRTRLEADQVQTISRTNYADYFTDWTISVDQKEAPCLRIALPFAQIVIVL